MGLYEGLQSVAGAGGTGVIDWDASAAAAKRTTDPGDVDLTAAEREGYRDDVRAARERVRAVVGIDFDVPEAVEVQHRHHWIDANAATFRRLFAPLDERPDAVGRPVRLLNTGSMAVALAYLARNVLGQYDPALFVPEGDPSLAVVHPNLERVAADLGVDRDRFRRWILFHEVTHVAEFALAPWLDDYIADRARTGVATLAEGPVDLDDPALTDVDAAMTAVEGYAELVMDRAFDREYRDLRAKLDARRQGGGPVTRLLRRVLGVQTKRRQYERGVAFFEAVTNARGLDATRDVWRSPGTLPSQAELDDPSLWLARVQNTT